MPKGHPLIFCEGFKYNSGDKFSFRKQTYEIIKTEPYEKIDGSITNIVYFYSYCVDCFNKFECTMPIPLNKKPNRRCRKCKRPLEKARVTLKYKSFCDNIGFTLGI